MDTTSNSSSIQADVFFVWDAESKKYVNLQSSITGLAPETLNTLNELATAVGGNPNFANDLQATTSALQVAVDAKADAFTLSAPLLWNLDPLHPEITELTADCYTKAEVTEKLDLKAPLASPIFTGTVGGLSKSTVGLGNVDNTADSAKVVSGPTQTALDLKAPLASPSFTGTVSGLSKNSVQLGNVDNTADSAKPVSTAVTNALNLKTDKSVTNNSAVAWSEGLVGDGYHYLNTGTDALVVRTNSGAISANFLGNVGGPTTDGKVIFYKDVQILGSLTGGALTKNTFGLGNVDNTADSAKPVSTATTTQLNLKAPLASPAFTGDILIMETAVPGQIKHAFRQTGLSEIRTELQVTGDIASTGKVWSQNEACLTGIQAYTKAEVNTALNLKANSANVFLKTETYSRAQSEALFTYKIDTYTSPLRLAINPITFATDLRIDPLMNLSIANITAASITTTGNAAITGSLSAADLTCNSIKSPSAASGVEIRSVGNAILAKVFDSGQTQLYNSLDVSTNVTIGGNLTLTGHLAAKPFVSLRVITGGGTPSTATVIGTPGASLVTPYGYISNVTLARGTAGATNAFIYTFTWTTPHPLGINYIVNAVFRTGSSTDPQPAGVITTNVTSSTSFNVWIRTTVGTTFPGTPNVFADGTFYVYTVP